MSGGQVSLAQIAGIGAPTISTSADEIAAVTEVVQPNVEQDLPRSR